MKKQLLLIMLLLSVATSAFAVEVEIDGLWYSVNTVTNEARGIKYKNNVKYNGDIVIPETVVYEGVTCSVTSIGGAAFSGCSGLTSVSIPNSVTSIGYEAFKGCSKLKKVIVKDIAAWCGISFSDVSSNPLSYAQHLYSDENTEITELIIPNSVTNIGESAFHSCSGLTSVSIPNSVTSIGNGAFNGCSSLTSIMIPNSVTSIGESAFESCSSLTSIMIPNSVTSIGESAFLNCSGLTSITIGNSVTSIGSKAFQSCNDLNKVIVKDVAAWCGISFSDNYSNPLYHAHHLYSDENTEITELIIPNSVTSIGDYTFSGCSGLTSITIPNSVTSIGGYAFFGCSGLTSVSIPNSVTSIGGTAFALCYGLTSVSIPNSVTSIGGVAFYKCSGLTSITIPNSVTSIGGYAFYECSGLTSVTIPNSVTSIEVQAFYHCSGLTSVIIGGGIKTISDQAFASCPELTDVTCYAENVPSTQSDAFMDSNIENATLHVPTGCRDAYLNADTWKQFREIVEARVITMATGSGDPRTMIGFSSANGLDFTNVSKVKAYIAVGFTASKDVLMARVNIVPPYTGIVLLTTEPGCTVEVPTTEENVYYANLLMPSVGSTSINPTETISGVEYTNLLVGKLSGTETMGFVQFSTPDYYTNKSYLHIPSSVYNQSSSAPLYDGLGMVFEDAEITDISQMMQLEQENEVFYDLQGSKVTPTRKGLYIKNGKKVVIK